MCHAPRQSYPRQVKRVGGGYVITENCGVLRDKAKVTKLDAMAKLSSRGSLMKNSGKRICKEMEIVKQENNSLRKLVGQLSRQNKLSELEIERLRVSQQILEETNKELETRIKSLEMASASEKIVTTKELEYLEFKCTELQAQLITCEIERKKQAEMSGKLEQLLQKAENAKTLLKRRLEEMYATSRSMQSAALLRDRQWQQTQQASVQDLTLFGSLANLRKAHITINIVSIANIAYPCFLPKPNRQSSERSENHRIAYLEALVAVLRNENSALTRKLKQCQRQVLFKKLI